MPYSRNSVHSNGYPADALQNNESPTYVMEHLATFSVAKETGIVYPADGMRRLLQLEKSNGIWSQKMHFRMDQNWVLIMDYETGVVMERFPVSLIQEPTAFTSNDPMEIYNNILVFIVGDERQLNDSQSEMHIFQCQSISAQDLVEDLKLLRSGHILPSHSKPRHIPPPPPTPPPEPPVNGMKVRDQVNVFNTAAHVEPGRGSSEFEGRDDETSSTSSEKYERDVTVLNHCFDDIEKFIARLQHAAAASRELERRQKSRKSKKKDLGDGMLTMRAKPPPEIEFIDIFQKFKLSFNLLAKLKAHIHDPNAPELVHFLFTPLALIVDASHDTHYGPNLPASVVTPLLTREAVNLLMNCVTSKETELWHSLGDAWLVPREQWKGNVPPYHPIFMDGWSPDYPVSDNRGSTPSEPIPMSSSDKRSRDESRLHREIHTELREQQYNRNLDHGHDDSSDYFDYEQQGSDMAPPAAPPLPLVGQYGYEGHPHPRRYSHEEREVCHSPDAGSEPEFASMMPSHVHNVVRDRDISAHSDISADSIERNGGISERFERNQMRWLDELRSRDAKIVQVTYPRTANNDKELTVVRGEFLEVLDDSRKWWKTRNSRGIIAHVPHTIVTPFSSVADSSELFNNPAVYGRGYERGGPRVYMGKEGVDRDHVGGGQPGPSSELPRGARSPVQSAPAPADWVRKESGMGDSESEDSDAEGGLGNVSRVVMRPPGHSGKAKKGHLCFDASFETGNLGKVDLVNDFEYDLYIRPDTCNPYHRMWFNFIVDNIKIDQRVLFNIVNISKYRNLYCDGMTPIVKSTSRKKWYRMPPHQVYFYQSPSQNNNYILTLSFCFDKEEEAYQFAYSYPYSYSKCQAYLELIEKKMLPHFKRELLGNSLQKRRIDMLTITNPNNMTSESSKCRVVVIFSRIHPGDSPTSFVCQGIIDFLISNHPIVEKLRNKVVFKIVPMMNPDGVVLGNFRSNLLGADFNRNWNHISQWTHPPLHAVFNTIAKLNQDKNVELDFIMDLHAHCSLCGVFVHGNTYEDVYRTERHTLFPKLLSQNVDGYEQSYCMFNREKHSRGSCRRVFSNLKETVNCYSVYTSFYGYTQKATKKFMHFNEESYHLVGRNIVRSFIDYYRYAGVIPAADQEAEKKAVATAAKKAKPAKKAHRRKATTKRVRFSKIRRKKKCKKFRHHHRRKPTTRSSDKTDTALREVTSVELKSKLDLKKGRIDFSNIEFPPIEKAAKVVKRRLLLSSCYRTQPLAVQKKDPLKTAADSFVKIINIG